MGAVGKVVGAAAAAAGVVGAVALGGMTAHRARLQRYRELEGPTGADSCGDEPADRSYSVVAGDGVALHVEEVGPANAPLTVILAHGWTLSAQAWQAQRAARADWAAGARLVLFDQRSHGRSSRAPRGHSRLADLADDLAAVIATAAPDGPIVLVGHSMGGMATLALAERAPELFDGRVRAVALLSTSATERPRSLTRLAQLNGSNPLLPWAMSLAGRYPQLAERGRDRSRDVVWLATRAWGFADPNVPAPLVDCVDRMIAATPMDVIAEFAPALLRHDVSAGLPVLAELPVLIAVGAEDRMTPPDRSMAMAAALPQAELLEVPGSGHLLPLERPEVVNAALARLVAAATA